MNFKKINIFDIFYYNLTLVTIFIIIGVLMLIMGIFICQNSYKYKTLGNLFIGLSIIAIIVFNVLIVVSNQSKELMNGKSTTNVQSVYHVNGDKIAKLNINGHYIKLKGDNELKKDDSVYIKAKNVEVLKNNTVKYNNLDNQLFKYEKVN
jgi:high-affinity K+ transport system ATPase subunit B